MGQQATLRTDAVYDGTQNEVAQIQYAKVSEAGSGDLIAAVTGKIIRVLGVALAAAAAETVEFQSGGSTALSGVMTMATGVPLVLPVSSLGWFETTAGQKLNLVQGGSVQISGVIVYVLI